MLEKAYKADYYILVRKTGRASASRSPNAIARTQRSSMSMSVSRTCPIVLETFRRCGIGLQQNLFSGDGLILSPICQLGEFFCY